MGRGGSTKAELETCDREVMGSNPNGCRAFLSHSIFSVVHAQSDHSGRNRLNMLLVGKKSLLMWYLKCYVIASTSHSVGERVIQELL